MSARMSDRDYERYKSTMPIISGRVIFLNEIYRQAKPLNSSKVLPIINSKSTIPFMERVITFTPAVCFQIGKSIGSLPAEQGGILGSSDGGKTIDHFYWDRQGTTSPVTYEPNVELVNSQVLPKWNAKGVRLIGFIHSHPQDCNFPSVGDTIYAKNLLEALDQERLLLPIVQNNAEGSFLYGYAAEACAGEMPIIKRYQVSRLEKTPEINRSELLDVLPLTLSPQKLITR